LGLIFVILSHCNRKWSIDTFREYNSKLSLQEELEGVNFLLFQLFTEQLVDENGKPIINSITLEYLQKYKFNQQQLKMIIFDEPTFIDRLR